MPTKTPPSAAPFLPAQRTLPEMNKAVQRCQGCELHLFATQAVFGEGPPSATVMFVGEQPGDQEDRQGKPFVGPAGRIWDRALADAGIPREDTYVTNAVKHFKFEERGKRRIHKKPKDSEVSACRPWLDAEIAAVKPKMIVALGATAALSLAGRDVSILRDRGKFIPMAEGRELFITVHPSFLLRQIDSDQREAEYGRFVEDLKKVAARLAKYNSST